MYIWTSCSYPAGEVCVCVGGSTRIYAYMCEILGSIKCLFHLALGTCYNYTCKPIRSGQANLGSNCQNATRNAFSLHRSNII